ncbi:hypothetical protein FDZ71_04625 [bacterium]|nr:MAG: hypothetical protein FDZ71_04625 [bacterium]
MRLLFGTLAFALMLAVLGCSRNDSAPGKVVGRVLRHGQGIPMAMVQVYPKAEQDRSTPPVAEIPSGEDGAFSLELPPGRYWVWAKATITEGSREVRLVGQATTNPVESFSGEGTTVKIELADPSGFAEGFGPEGTGLMGRVKFAEGTQAEGATVYVYPGTQERPIGPGFVAAVDVAGDASFRMNLAIGKYTLAVRQRKSSRDYGPPEKSDRVAVRQIEIAEGGYLDVGEITPTLIDQVAWKEITSKMGSDATRIEGLILDAKNRPVEGIRVLAFKDSRLTGKPAFVSPPSGKDGRYVLPISGEGGTFFLGARSRIGGPASPGEKTGHTLGPNGLGIKVKPGDNISKINISVEEVW